jgi:Homeodomain-like domain
MDAEISGFWAEVRKRRGARKKGAAPYEARMIARGRALALRLLDAGEPAVEVARRLGIARKTLDKWLAVEVAPQRGAKKATPGSFLRVGIDGGGEARSVGPQSAVLISPRGYRMEGIDVATAIAVLREVG